MTDMTTEQVYRDVTHEVGKQLNSTISYATCDVEYLNEIYLVRDYISNQLWAEAV